jgi:hypothetical protein
MTNINPYIENKALSRNEQEIIDFMYDPNLEEIIRKWSEKIKQIARDINIEIASKLKYIRQETYSTDPKKTTELLIKEKTSQCEVENGKRKEFFDNR